jgi:tetratricopeptide (TPR) repeat protein
MNKLKKALFIFLLLIVNAAVLGQQRTVFKLPFPRQYKTLDTIIDSLALQDPTLALRTLKKLERQARATNNELAMLNYKRSEIRYRYIRTIHNEKRPELNQLIADTEQLIAKVDEEQYPVIAALLHFQIGNSLDYQKYNYKEQFKHYLLAYEIFKDIPIAQFPYRYYSQYAIALAYYQFEEYDKAIALSKEVEVLFPTKDFNSIMTANLVGLSYLALKKYDQAIAAFEWILINNTYALNPMAWRGIALGNMGEVYQQKGESAAAIRYLKQGIPILKQEAVYGNMASAAIILAGIYLSQKQLVEAKVNIDLAIYGNTKDRKISNSYSVNKVLSDYHQLRGDSTLALYYLQLTNAYKDSIDIRTNITKRFKAEINFAKEKQLLLLNQSEQKIVNQRVIVIAILLFSLLSFITLYIFYDRGRLKFKLEQKELLDKNEKISSELDRANARLEQYMQSRLQKNLENPDSEVQENLVSKLVNESNIFTDLDWIEFKNLFEQAHPRYLQRVKDKLPKISPAELRLIAIHKLNLNTNEMALILNITPDAVRKSKKRLSLKIGENLEQSFDEFTSSIL